MQLLSSSILRTLIETGLNDKEALIYYAALSLGSAKVSDIARAAQVKRPTAYTVIESLMSKGLIIKEAKGFKTFYVAVSPEHLESLIESRKENFKKNLPDLLALHNLKGGINSIQTYSGLTAVKNLYKDVIKKLRPKDFLFAISDHEKWSSIDEEFFSEFKILRGKSGAKIKLLLTDTPKARKNLKLQANYNEEVRLLPRNTNLSSSMMITPWMVAIHQLILPISATVMENKNIVEMNKEYFEIMWNSCAN